MQSSSDALSKYTAIIMKAGMLPSEEAIHALVRSNVDVLDGGAAAALDQFVNGQLPIEETFTLLDASKSLVAKNLLHRRDAERSGNDAPDVVMSVPTPGTVSHYLRAKGHDTAILSFHVMGRDRVAIFLAKFVTNGDSLQGIRGFGDVFYDFAYFDGLKPEFMNCVDAYAVTLARGEPDFELVRKVFGFIGTTIFMLLLKHRPPTELIFIPHKLFYILPLHALSVEFDGRRHYLHDYVERISYASCLQELAYGGLWHGPKPRLATNHSERILAVLDHSANLPWIETEERFTEVARGQLEPKGIHFDVVRQPTELPKDFQEYIWVSWSSHAKSSTTKWGDSVLHLGGWTIDARSIANTWNFNLAPVVILSACESALDTSSGFGTDEYCGLDIAFRIAGARAVVASLWPIDDDLAALTAMTIQAWWFQGHMPPDASITALQRHLRTGEWKQFLLSREQLNSLPKKVRGQIERAQAPFRDLPREAFRAERCWAVFRCHGR